MTTEYITEVATRLRLATSPRHDVHAVYPVNQDMIMVMYNLHEEHKDSLTNDMCTSVSIAAWTTWLARKKLYVEVLDVLKERVCYMDTDSCIFETRPGDDPQAVTVGTYFGDLTDEISGEYGPDATMVEFASAGKKNYGFRVSTGATKVKVRGISLTVRVQETLNWNSILMAITNVVEDVSAGLSPEEAADEHAMIVEYPHSIRRAGHALKHIGSDWQTHDGGVVAGRYAIPRRMTIAWLQEQCVYTKQRLAPKNYRQRIDRTYVTGIHETWQADLLDMGPVFAEQNDKKRFLLTIVDVLSRFAFVRPLQRKTPAEVVAALESVVRQGGVTPGALHTDRGTEFYNTQMKAWLKKHDIMILVIMAHTVTRKLPWWNGLIARSSKPVSIP